MSSIPDKMHPILRSGDWVVVRVILFACLMKMMGLNVLGS